MFDLFEQFDGAPKLGEEGIDSNSNENRFVSSTNFGVSDLKSRVLVLSVGGSVFFSGESDTQKLIDFCGVINELKREGFSFVIVVGGGSTAREYQARAKSIGANNFELDEIGISISRTNALFLPPLIIDSHKNILLELTDARTILELGRIPIFGGLTPGQSTDSVAALLTEMLNGVFVNISDVDGIFNKDPNKNGSAELLGEISHSKMVSLLKPSASKPGAHSFVDPHAARILQRSKLTSIFVGSDLTNFVECVRGNEFRGTIVRTE